MHDCEGPPRPPASRPTRPGEPGRQGDPTRPPQPGSEPGSRQCALSSWSWWRETWGEPSRWAVLLIEARRLSEGLRFCSAGVGGDRGSRTSCPSALVSIMQSKPCSGNSCRLIMG
eukprot:5076982-Alexandrium_andersonii.AAC.1